MKKRIIVSLALSAGTLLIPATPASAASNCVPASMVGSAGYAEGPNGQRLYACPTADAQPATSARNQPAPRKATNPRRTSRTVCGTWWVRGLAANGSGGTRRGHRSRWHIVRECRKVAR
jgi:hypothetical protein